MSKYTYAVYADTGAQPLTSDDGKILLAVNGEIYNHRTLRKNLKKQAAFKTHSDCEVIIYLVCLGQLRVLPKKLRY